MTAEEFRELVTYIRNSLEYTLIGLDSQEINALNKRLDSDAYKAAVAVDEFFELKRNQSEASR